MEKGGRPWPADAMDLRDIAQNARKQKELVILWDEAEEVARGKRPAYSVHYHHHHEMQLLTEHVVDVTGSHWPHDAR